LLKPVVDKDVSQTVCDQWRRRVSGSDWDNCESGWHVNKDLLHAINLSAVNSFQNGKEEKLNVTE